MSAGIVYPLFGGSLRYRQLVVFWEKTMPSATSLWERYLMALDEVTERLERITSALDKARVPHALVGGRPSRSGWRPKIRPLCARRKTWISFFAPRICPHRCTHLLGSEGAMLSRIAQSNIARAESPRKHAVLLLAGMLSGCPHKGADARRVPRKHGTQPTLPTPPILIARCVQR